MNKLKSVDSPVVLAVTRHGGHVGFLKGLWPLGANLLDRAVPEFATAVFEHLDELSTATRASTSSPTASET